MVGLRRWGPLAAQGLRYPASKVFALAIVATTLVTASTRGGASITEDSCPLEAPDGGFISFVAWTSIFFAQPHHVAAPFKRDLVAPITMLGICDPPQWNSQNWAYVGMRGSDWMATPTSATPVQFIQGGNACSQELNGISVMTALEGHAAFRMHFAGCSRPSSTIAVRVTNETQPSTGTGEPTVEGVGLLEFMCQISPQECEAATARAARAKGSSGSLGTARGEVGMGRCTGYGVRPHRVTDPPATAQGCADECRKRIERNLADPSQGSCRGYAWSTHLQSCLVYDGWPVTGADNSSPEEGYLCDNMTTVEPLYVKPTAPPAKARLLDVARIFMDARAVTARRIQVSPFHVGCFKDFDWYIIDRWLHVSPSDWPVLLELTKTNTQDAKYLFHHPMHGGHAPRTNLVVERVCLRDCAGALRAECKGEDKMGTPPGYAISPDGSLVARESEQEVPQSNVNVTSMLQKIVGAHAADTFTDRQFLKWAVILAFFTMMLGGISTTLTGMCWRRRVPPAQPKYHTVEEVKLIYEGEEEETVALRSGVDGSMNLMNVAGRGISSTWQPSKANSASYGSKKSPMWGTS